jgi:CO/xanthine dehydrogenase Mo-binding subunit
MRVAAAAADGRVPADDELDEEHRCRCGTHPRIRRAAERAREVLAGASAAPVAAPEVAPADDPQPAVLSRDVDRVEAWLQLLPDGRVAALTGRVELGQGVRTALGRIVASQLGVRPDLVRVVSTTTALSADEKYTAGSNSVDTGGAALGRAAVAFRRHLHACAAKLLEVAPEDVAIEPDGVVRHGARQVTFAELAGTGPVVGPITDDDVLDWRRLGEMPPVGRSDLPAKVTGAAAFIHDMVLPDMLHARALLPPSYDAQLVSLDADGARALPGVVDVVVDGRLVLAIAER